VQQAGFPAGKIQAAANTQSGLKGGKEVTLQYGN